MNGFNPLDHHNKWNCLTKISAISNFDNPIIQSFTYLSFIIKVH